MLTLQPLTPASQHLPFVQALYERAFPANERRVFSDMLLDPSGICTVHGLFDGERCVGFTCTLLCIDIAHIIYFAIDEPLRGQGLGAEALRLLHTHYAPCRVIVDIERTGAVYPDNAVRLRRKAFYRRCGYRENPVYYRWQEEDYEVMSCGGAITYEEFCDFWDAAYAANPLIG